MTLSDFIEANLTELIDDWTAYARRLSAEGSALNVDQLRNSVRDLLVRIAADMRETQTAAQQTAKSLGDRPPSESGFNETAHRHADDRLAQGFGINEVVAEYRAMRASVLRRWQGASQLDASSFQEMVRFNEAIDQMLAESVRQYAQRTERIRDLFGGVLAHDLRSPLGAILNSVEILLRDNGLSPLSVKAIAHVQHGAGRMKRMIDDLFLFTRARLGDTLPLEPTPQDMGHICQDAADEVRAAFPDAQIVVQLTGELDGNWDAGRISQLLVNLISNAVQHGSGKICVRATGFADRVTVAVSNTGRPIPAQLLPTLFDPLTRATRTQGRQGTTSGMGLGLYICRSIAVAHKGTIRAESTENGTIFTLQVPRFLISP
ncbi:sensor histidine kinase [Paraburkholderia heleia]|uniref:sensor histidine kinase n=1 Tax=Paraburkholderia heleia TaxID=634127 RepID=UPI0005A61664|nr:HAMP domain-containing sensor histidine kinase [Paraburkholderia heleia]